MSFTVLNGAIQTLSRGGLAWLFSQRLLLESTSAPLSTSQTFLSVSRLQVPLGKSAKTSEDLLPLAQLTGSSHVWEEANPLQFSCLCCSQLPAMWHGCRWMEICFRVTCLQQGEGRPSKHKCSMLRAGVVFPSLCCSLNTKRPVIREIMVN